MLWPTLLSTCLPFLFVLEALGLALNPPRYLDPLSREALRGSQSVVHEFSKALAARTGSAECRTGIVTHLEHVGMADRGWHLTETEQTSVAISMTLCAMMSARQPCPKECLQWAPWAHGHEQGGVNSFSKAQQSQCLSSLHRSAQDWTTFNGYLSDATQLWFALAEQRKTDQMEKMHRNITLEKAILLEELRSGEHDRMVAFGKTQEYLDAQLRFLQSAIGEAGLFISQLKRETAEHRRSDEAVGLAINALTREQTHLHALLHQELGLFREALSKQLEEQTTAYQLVLARQASDLVEGSLQKHARSVDDIKTQASQAISLAHSAAAEEARAMSNLAYVQLDSLRAFADETRGSFLEARQELGDMHMSMTNLAPMISQALRDSESLSELISQRQQVLLQTAIFDGLGLAEEAKDTLSHLNQSLSSFIQVVQAPWSVITASSGFRMAFVVCEGGLQALRIVWTAVYSISKLTGYDTVPLFLLGRWVFRTALKWSRISKAGSRSFADGERLRTKVKRRPAVTHTHAQDVVVVQRSYQELERRVHAERRRAFSEAL